MRLVIGNKNYSSWSLRPWLLLEAFGVDFDEQQVSLAEPNLSAYLKQYSDSARVPVLQEGDLTIWDSLAICEYINDAYLDGQAWPTNPQTRGLARAVTAEMHGGLPALRAEMPMNCRAKRFIEPSQQALADIQRVDEIWSNYAQTDAHGDVRLFGQFGIADCFFAPVVMRFVTYGTEISAASQSYLNSMTKHPTLQKWVSAAVLEDEIVPEDEAGIDRD